MIWHEKPSNIGLVDMGLSIRAYARHRGVTDTAVHKAIRAGRITPEGDGTIDAERADRDWMRNSQARVIGTRAVASEASAARMPQGASATERAVEIEGGVHGGGNSVGGNPGGTSFLQARTVNEVVKAQTNKVRLARLRGELVDRPQAIAHVFKLARTERDAWLNWPARISALMALRLGVDPHTMHVVLEAAVREHLQELGDVRARID